MADRVDLKELTLRKLKELAKKHVGVGHTKLRTRAELLSALKKMPKALSAAIRSKGSKVAPKAKPVARASPAKSSKSAVGSAAAALKATSKGPKARAKPKAAIKKKIQSVAKPPVKKAGARPGGEDISEETPTVGGRSRSVKAKERPAAAQRRPTSSKPTSKHVAVSQLPSRTRAPARAGGRTPVAEESKSKSPREGPAQVFRFDPPLKRNGAVLYRVAEPLVEGFFVARIAGTREVRSHHLVEENVPPQFQLPEDPERLGELPAAYGSDSEVALARDPRTLFYLWDFSSDTVFGASEGLFSPRAVLVLFEEGRVVREVDFALESRSYYLHDLIPGRTYRVESYFVGADGHRRRIGRGSNSVTLPPEGPSLDTTVRFMRVPWGQPLNRRGETLAGPVERRYLAWERVPLPNSGGFVDRIREWTERDERQAQVPSSRTYLGSSFTGLGSSEHLGASERWTRGERT